MPDLLEMTVDRILGALRRMRIYRTGYELDLQSQVADCLQAAGIPAVREFRLAPRKRIDFWVPLLPGGTLPAEKAASLHFFPAHPFTAHRGVGIEIKKGKPSARAVAEQAARYCAEPAIAALILVVERSLFFHPREIDGKPVYYLSLSKLWGIAL